MKQAHPHPGLNTDLQAWRHRALSVMLWVVVAVRGVQFLHVWTSGGWSEMPLASRVPFSILLLLLLGMALFRQLPHALRGWALVCLGFANILVTFMATGWLDGPLPLALLTIPIHTGIFLGRRACWVSATLSVTLFAGMALASLHGIPHLHVPSPPLASDPMAALFAWLVVFLPVLILLDRFTALLHRLAFTEKKQRIQIQAETSERRFLEGALLEASERERQAVGHELHDGICQQITGAMLQCKAAEQTASLGGALEPQHLRKISSILTDSLDQVHDLARGLSPGVLTPDALVPSLRDLTRRTRETFELSCELETQDCPERLDPAASTHLYRIAQEALANAVKHGRPARILIRLAARAGDLVLEVRNDGHPLAAPAPDGEGMGLRIMRYRSELIGGVFQLITEGGSGVCVRCAVPLARMGCQGDT